jgi:hypothetical protein
MAPSDRSVMFALYVPALAAAAGALLMLYRAARSRGLPAILTVCVAGGALFYLSSLLPGMLSMLTAPAVAATMIVLSALAIWIAARTDRSGLPGTPRAQASIVAIVVPALPALVYYARTSAIWRHPAESLSWDAVSYHLPGFVEFYQAHSLMSLRGPYQTYSYAFELIGNFPAYFFQDGWGIFAAHAYAIVFCFAALFHLTQIIWRTRPPSAAWQPIAAYTAAVSMFVWLFPMSTFGLVGNNDIFQCACVLAFLGLLIEASEALTEARSRDAWPLIVLSSVALGLAVATKPTALAYLPLPVAAVGLAALDRRRQRVAWSWAGDLWRLAVAFAIVFAVGGFFIVRNLLTIGAVVAPETAAWQFSILANLKNPAMFQATREAIAVATSLLTPLAIAALTRGRGVACWLLVLCSCAAIASFIVAPWVVLAVPDGVQWERRLGMPLFALLTLACGTLCAVLLGAIAPRLMAWRPAASHDAPGWRRAGWRPVAITVVLVALAVWAPLRLRPADGLPGFDRLKGLPRTTVYEWVQHRVEPTRIYAAGLRPYGLYGPGWRNGLFYDLHSSVLRPDPDGRARVAAIVLEFRPELVLISVDAHDGERGKPLIDWLKSEPDCFNEVFEDEEVSGFAVKAGCADVMRTYTRSAAPVRMTG